MSRTPLDFEKETVGGGDTLRAHVDAERQYREPPTC